MINPLKLSTREVFILKKALTTLKASEIVRTFDKPTSNHKCIGELEALYKKLENYGGEDE